MIERVVVGKNADPALTLAELLRRSEVAVIGIDGGGLDDLLGLAVLGRERLAGPPPEDGRPDPRKWFHWGHAWAHQIVLERRKGGAKLVSDIDLIPRRGKRRLLGRFLRYRKAAATGAACAATSEPD